MQPFNQGSHKITLKGVFAKDLKLKRKMRKKMKNWT